MSITNIILSIDGAEEAPANSNPAPDADFIKIGKQQYMVCGACHGQRGEGTAAGPPLAGSEWVNGPVENLINIQLRGLIGRIKVKGQEYDFPGGMQPMAYQTDEQVAAVLTYVRSSFGNDAPSVSPEAVAALRSEVGKPQLTADELVTPESMKTSTTSEPSETDQLSNKYADMDSSIGAPIWIVAGILLFAVVCLVGFFKK